MGWGGRGECALLRSKVSQGSGEVYGTDTNQRQLLPRPQWRVLPPRIRTPRDGRTPELVPSQPAARQAPQRTCSAADFISRLCAESDAAEWPYPPNASIKVGAPSKKARGTPSQTAHVRYVKIYHVQPGAIPSLAGTSELDARSIFLSIHPPTPARLAGGRSPGDEIMRALTSPNQTPLQACTCCAPRSTRESERLGALEPRCGASAMESAILLPARARRYEKVGLWPSSTA